jgi:hypothetical protein
MEKPKFSDCCFWDYHYDKFNIDDCVTRKFIIGRVLSRGNTNDEKMLFEYYGIETIKEEIVKIRYLDKKILNYYSLILDIKKEYFRAFHNKADTWI